MAAVVAALAPVVPKLAANALPAPAVR